LVSVLASTPEKNGRCQHRLNDIRIRQAKAKDGNYKLTDFDALQLLVTPTGSKLWRLAYRFAGKQKELALGTYPTVTLAQARERRDAARRLVANGTDPSTQRQLEKIAAAAGGNTFREVAAEFFAKQAREGTAAL
jgi:hypothetical protein